jgi:hypothetical protein
MSLDQDGNLSLEINFGSDLHAVLSRAARRALSLSSYVPEDRQTDKHESRFKPTTFNRGQLLVKHPHFPLIEHLVLKGIEGKPGSPSL